VCASQHKAPPAYEYTQHLALKNLQKSIRSW
jgi:hypothetical protein